MFEVSDLMSFYVEQGFVEDNSIKTDSERVVVFEDDAYPHADQSF